MNSKIEVNKTIKVDIGGKKAVIAVVGAYSNNFGKYKSLSEWISHILSSPDYDEIKLEDINELSVKKGERAFFITEFTNHITEIHSQDNHERVPIEQRRLIDLSKRETLSAEDFLKKELTDKSSMLKREARFVRDDFYAKKSGNGKIHR